MSTYLGKIGKIVGKELSNMNDTVQTNDSEAKEEQATYKQEVEEITSKFNAELDSNIQSKGEEFDATLKSKTMTFNQEIDDFLRLVADGSETSLQELVIELNEKEAEIKAEIEDLETTLNAKEAEHRSASGYSEHLAVVVSDLDAAFQGAA